MHSKRSIAQDTRMLPLLFRILLFNLGSLLGIGLVHFFYGHNKQAYFMTFDYIRISVTLLSVSKDDDAILNILLASCECDFCS
jgi:hypothetical protein